MARRAVDPDTRLIIDGLEERNRKASLGRKVHLCVFVKVRANWLDDPAHYRPLGLDFEA